MVSQTELRFFCDDAVVWSAIKILVEPSDYLAVSLELGRVPGSKLQNIYGGQAARLDQKLERLTGNRITMRRISIKAITADHEVFRVLCFQDKQTSGPQRPYDFIQQAD